MIELNVQKRLAAASGQLDLDVQMEIPDGAIVTLYGKSGAGKTSILRMIAGLLDPDTGTIKVGNKVWYDQQQKINRSPQERQVGFLFQDYGLFPNMSVYENLKFALPKDESKKWIDELIEMIQIGDLKSRRPATLSGGQKQRVALARALVQRPRILMLDEPLAALDQEIRTKLQNDLLAIHNEYRFTILLISHDIGEILKLSDQIFLLKNGKISIIATEDFWKLNQPYPNQVEIQGKIKHVEQLENGGLFTLENIEDVTFWNQDSHMLKEDELIRVYFSVIRHRVRKINNI